MRMSSSRRFLKVDSIVSLFVSLIPPTGYNTQIGDGGNQLSGGQRFALDSVGVSLKSRLRVLLLIWSAQYIIITFIRTGCASV
jgi:ABC-type bacteriocin/lantibiotic exporter with double-glycine peptidase domain